MPKRVLSGIKPTDQQLHLGNYYGALVQFVELQASEENYIFIADLHALTTIHDPDELRANTHEVAVEYLACGLDPVKSVLWRQSDVPEVCELTWLLSCVTGMGLLERAHAYKAARDEGREVNMGLFCYPILMAADILAYQSDLVPVGEDQVQHIEMTRDMAGYFNHTFGGEVLKLPQARLPQVAKRVPGVDGRKMSKSYGNSIGIFEDEASLRRKIMRIVTDTVPLGQPLDAEACTVFALHSLYPGPELDELRRRYQTGDIGYGEAKKLLVPKVLDDLATVRGRYAELKADPGYVEDVLHDGAARARAVARATLEACRQASGFGPVDR